MSVLKVNLNNILKFDDFIKSNEKGEIPKAAKGGYIKIREDYINSFINEHEPNHEEEE